jgi:hypothetical protein
MTHKNIQPLHNVDVPFATMSEVEEKITIIYVNSVFNIIEQFFPCSVKE